MPALTTIGGYLYVALAAGMLTLTTALSLFYIFKMER